MHLIEDYPPSPAPEAFPALVDAFQRTFPWRHFLFLAPSRFTHAIPSLVMDPFSASVSAPASFSSASSSSSASSQPQPPSHSPAHSHSHSYSPTDAALLSAMALWGARLAPHPHDYSPYEPHLLALTIHHLARADLRAVAPAPDPQLDLLQVGLEQELKRIQALVLLSLYLLEAGRPATGRAHAAAAASLALSAGLHLHLNLPANPSGGATETYRDQPFVLAPRWRGGDVDVGSAQEGPAAWWAVVLLDSYWVAVSGLPACIPPAFSPLPLPAAPAPGPGPTLPFTSPAPENDESGEAPLLVQAALLLARAVAVTTSPADPQTQAQATWALDCSIATLRARLATAETVTFGENEIDVAHLLAAVALIRLHLPHDPARCVAAARAAVRLHCAPRPGDEAGAGAEGEGEAEADPIVAPLLGTLTHVFLSTSDSAAAAAADPDLHATLAALAAIAQRGQGRSVLVRMCLEAATQQFHDTLELGGGFAGL